MMTDIRSQLTAQADPRLKEFHSRMIPHSGEVLGVPLPVLRKLARQIACGDWRTYWHSTRDRYHEEYLLRAMVLSCVKCPIGERIRLTREFVPLIRNWAVCDAFTWVARTPDERREWWQFLLPMFDSKEEFTLRFAARSALSNFIDEEHLPLLFERFDHLTASTYYSSMGVAWAVSVCYVKFPATTEEWLKRCALDTPTFNRSIQKICESLRVEAPDKLRLRAMKRPRKGI